MTTQELLDQVNAAYTYLLTHKSQSYQIAGRTMTYLDLGELRKMRNSLQLELNQAGRAGRTFPIRFA